MLRPISSIALSLLLVTLVQLSLCNPNPGNGLDQNLQYIERILEYLNNNHECTLPTFEEVDELQKCFSQLQVAWGDEFETKLTQDQLLAHKTLLSHWDDFRFQMNSAVIVRSAKKRAFLCKIEDYQEAKFGESVCTRIKNIKGPITERIFEKNAIVRYLRHLDDGQVPEPPPTTTVAPPQDSDDSPSELAKSDSSPQSDEVDIEPDENRTPVAEESHNEDTHERSSKATDERINTEDVIHPPAELESPEEEKVETEDPTVTEEPEHASNEPTGDLDASRHANSSLERGPQDPQEVEPIEDHKNGTELCEDKPDSGVRHTFIGEFVFKFDKFPKKISIEIERDDGDVSRDPLDDIPVPPADDKHAVDDHKPADISPSPETQQSSTGLSIDSGPEPSAPETTTPYPMFDESGAEYIEDEYDEAQLERLVRAPKRDWDFDPIYGYFKWPDESNESFSPSSIKLDDSLIGLGGVWFQYATDPYAYDAYLQSLITTTTTPRPKINGAALRRSKNKLIEEYSESVRRGELFGWNNESNSEKIKPFYPEVRRDRWRNLADNNFCKLSYSRDYIKNKSKSGLKAVKSMFKHGSKTHSSDQFREQLLMGPSSE